MKKWQTLLLLATMIPMGNMAQAYRKVSAESLTETLHKNKVTRMRAELFFEFPGGRMITWNLEPEEFIYLSNPMGEAKIYYPKKNQLVNRKDPVFSSQNHQIYQFLNNEYYDLGLQKIGFRVISTEHSNGMVVTTWQAPVSMLAQVDKIDLVHEDMLPIYAEYRNTRGEVTLKLYYSDFMPVYESMIPSRVTEILFLQPGDSIIRRTTYSDMMTGTKINPRGFNFIIPEDAKVVH